MSQEEWVITTNDDDDGFFKEPKFATREGAIAAAPSALDLSPGDTFWVARIRRPDAAELLPPIRYFLDEIREVAAEEFGERSESWLEDVTDQQKMDLESAITEVFLAWCHKHNHRPKFLSVDSETCHVVPERRASGDGEP